MPHWFHESEVVLNVSHCEGASNSMLEAMVHGKPVLAADILGNRSFISFQRSQPDAGTGLLYFTSSAPVGYQRVHDWDDFAHRLKYLLDHPHRGRDIGARAAQWARSHLDPASEASQYMSLYRSLLGLPG